MASVVVGAYRRLWSRLRHDLYSRGLDDDGGGAVARRRQFAITHAHPVALAARQALRGRPTGDLGGVRVLERVLGPIVCANDERLGVAIDGSRVRR